MRGGCGKGCNKGVLKGCLDENDERECDMEW